MEKNILGNIIAGELEMIAKQFEEADNKKVFDRLLTLSSSVVRWSQALGRDCNKNDITL